MSTIESNILIFMQIFMLQSRRGSEDGFSVRFFEAGLLYDVADTLARAFIQADWATETQPLPPEGVIP